MGRNLPFAKQAFSSLSKRVLLGCALVAMLLKVLIPAGFMLAQNATTQLVAVVICTGSGSQTLFMDQDGQFVSKDSDKKGHGGSENGPGDHPCTFAHHGTALLANISPDLETVAFTQAPSQLRLALMDQAPGRGLAAPPPPATASPFQI
jgi:hypothetical protein